MAMIDHANEIIDDAEFETHLATYRRFIRMVWWNAAAIVIVLIFLAAWAG